MTGQQLRRRRLIPPIAAGIVFVVATSPAWGGVVRDSTASRWTLLLLATVFAVKTGIFYWMRRRMVG